MEDDLLVLLHGEHLLVVFGRQGGLMVVALVLRHGDSGVRRGTAARLALPGVLRRCGSLLQ